ncbi:MAG: MBL fold metallo-hydrolase, partial [Muribaculaceae bacterium]|nr:MBL fold metallo-hydrolase [Muribaculaceae bacterium]
PVYDNDGKEDPHRVKVPAAWLIDHAGLKGMRIGGAEVYPKQCLVIANTGKATGKDVSHLADYIIDCVNERFGVILEPEVNFIDTDINVTILGSGTSKGVPEVACGCRVCRSKSHFDKRLRASALVRTMGLEILIDVSPDFRTQALQEDLKRVDAVLLTHSHYDHVGGLDDLRPFCAYRDVPIYLKKDVNDDLHRRLDYCFRPHPYPGVPTFEMHEIDDRPFFINGVKIIPVKVMHGSLPILGFRIGRFAYITDTKTIAEEELEKLEGLDVLVVNALRFREHFSHMSIGEALALIERLKPKTAYLTHFNHEVGKHFEIEEKLPPNVHPCYDGLRFTVK